MMKALIYQGPGKKVLEERPIPEVKAPTDAIVKVSKTTTGLIQCKLTKRPA
jgi:alcohol dehydrogenase